MKLFLKIVLLLLLPAFAKAQNRQQIESTYLILQHAANDTVRMGAYSKLGGFYDDVSVDSGLYYCNKGIEIAEKLDLQLNKAEMLAFMAWPLMKTGNYPEALKVINQGFKITEDPSIWEKTGYLQKGQTQHMYRLRVIGLLYSALESLYGYVGDYEKQISTARATIPHLEAAGDMINMAGLYPDIGDGYLKLNKLDSALFYQQKSLEYYSKLSFEDRKFEGSTYTSLGTIYEKMGNTDLSRENYQKAIRVSELHDNPRHTGNACLQLASLYQSLKKADSSFLYAKKALAAFKQGGYTKEVAIAYRMISDYYHDRSNTDSSFAYLRQSTLLNDSLGSMEKKRLQEFQVAAFNQQLSLQQLEQEQIEKEGKLKTIAIIALLALFGTIGFLLYRNNRQNQRANQILQKKNSQINQTLSNLKATQSQLIQSEKMASLGELTAGIAHEIQNPLNFVNNFSEVNKEMLEELKDAIAKNDKEEIDAIINDLLENESKVTHHGKRAEGIVKSMLQHSRTSSGEKELTDINALCDEYMRLAYHGFRAKDKSLPGRQAGFNTNFKTDLDPDLPKINVVPQDIGRVILNLVNNAFQAVSTNQTPSHPEALEGSDRGTNITPRPPKGGDMNSPIVIVSTRRLASPLGDKGVAQGVIITISDNGPGIPNEIKDKIFQPFFTTKPTGQGTGLGLSMSYDIVTKGHGGTIEVESRPGNTKFVISLPSNP